METTAYHSIKSAPARATTTWKPPHRKQELPVPEEVGGTSLHTTSVPAAATVEGEDSESNGEYA